MYFQHVFFTERNQRPKLLLKRSFTTKLCGPVLLGFYGDLQPFPDNTCHPTVSLCGETDVVEKDEAGGERLTWRIHLLFL